MTKGTSGKVCTLRRSSQPPNEESLSYSNLMLSQFQKERLVTPVSIQPPAMRVLHVVESLDDQAVESWLLRVASVAAKDFPQIKWTFFCVRGTEGRRDDFARALGADVIHSRYEIGNKIRFVRSLRHVMKAGRYDILHCHHDVMSAMYLLASKGLPFKRRIVHVHNTSLSLPTPNRLKADMLREPMRQICLRMANQIVGISKEALESMVQNGSLEVPRHSIVHYAVDTARFAQVLTSRSEFRRQLGLPEASKVLLFGGRMCEYKNQMFVIVTLRLLL
jgi:glycosyltransferase EpsF